MSVTPHTWTRSQPPHRHSAQIYANSAAVDTDTVLSSDFSRDLDLWERSTETPSGKYPSPQPQEPKFIGPYPGVHTRLNSPIDFIMSAPRRSSRVGSRAPSGLGSPGPSAPPTPLPKTRARSARGNGPELPAIGVASSSAYGTGVDSQPRQMMHHAGSTDVGRVLDMIGVGENREPPQKPGRGARGNATQSARGAKASKTPSHVGHGPKSRASSAYGPEYPDESSINAHGGFDTESPEPEINRRPDPILEEQEGFENVSEQEFDGPEEHEEASEQPETPQQQASARHPPQHQDQQTQRAQQQLPPDQLRNRSHERPQGVRQQQNGQRQRNQQSQQQQGQQQQGQQPHGQRPAQQPRHGQPQRPPRRLAQGDDDSDSDEDESPQNPNWRLFNEQLLFFFSWKYVALYIVKNAFSIFMSFVLFNVLATLLLHLLKKGEITPLRFYGQKDFRHNFGQFIPEFVVHPMTGVFEGQIDVIDRRLKAIEYDLAYALHKNTLHDEDINALKMANVLRLEFDKSGKPQLPITVYHALRDRMRNDMLLNSGRHIDSDSNRNASLKNMTLDDYRQMFLDSKLMDDILTGVTEVGNDHGTSLKNLRSTVDTGFTKIQANQVDYHQKMSVTIDTIVYKERAENKKQLEEAINQVRLDWAESTKHIEPQLARLHQQMHQILQQIQQFEQHQGALSRAQVESIFHKLITRAKLEGLANAKIDEYARNSERRVNYFAPSHGAIVDPHHTSPDWVIPSMKTWPVTRLYWWLRAEPLPVANTPIVALTKWDEYGECWCTPVKGDDGSGASLEVIMGHKIYIDQIAIEHISPTETLEPGSAPREFEIMALFNGEQAYQVVKEASLRQFPDSPLDNTLRLGYVRIAEFTYDLSLGQGTQAFPIQLDLKALGQTSGTDTSTQKILVRAKNNWGDGRVPYTCFYRIRAHGSPLSAPS